MQEELNNTELNNGCTDAVKKKSMQKPAVIAAEVILVLILVPLIIYFALTTKQKNSVKPYIEALHEYGLTQTVTVNKTELNYRIFGNADAAHTFVFISDLGDFNTAISMEPLSNLLSQNGNRVVLISRAGYGLSEDTSSKRTADNVISDYREALDKLEIEGPYILLAHNYGAAYALYWQYCFKEEVESIILLDSPSVTQMYIEFFDINDQWSSFDEFKKIQSGKIGSYFNPNTVVSDVKDNINAPSFTEEQKDLCAVMTLLKQYPEAYSSEYRYLFEALELLDSNYMFEAAIPVCYISSNMYMGDFNYFNQYHMDELSEEYGTDANRIAEIMDEERQFCTEAMNAYSSFAYYIPYSIDAGKASFEFNPTGIAGAIADFMNEYSAYFSGEEKLDEIATEDFYDEDFYDEESSEEVTE